MAFLNRISILLKQTASNPSLLEAVRSMSTSSKVFVGGLSYGTDDMSLTEVFSKYGNVVEAKVVIDRNTGRSKGFAFITYTSTEAASSAIRACDGQELHGRKITVNYATEKSRSGSFGGGFGPGGGFNFSGLGGNYNSQGYQGSNFGSSGAGNFGDGYDVGKGYTGRSTEFDSSDNFTGTSSPSSSQTIGTHDENQEPEVSQQSRWN